MFRSKTDDYVKVELTTDDFLITSAELKTNYIDINDYEMNKYRAKVKSLIK